MEGEVDCALEVKRMELWVKEISDVAESCGYEGTYIPERGGFPAVAVAKQGFRPITHISESVWECLKAHGDAVQWLTLWLNACLHQDTSKVEVK